ncbi:MOFRL family protein, partial [Bacillus cereus]
FLAFATDGNDFIPGIAGAWATNYTYQKIVERGIDWNDILNDNNTYQGLSQLAQLITGVRTSLNLCDLYVLFSE